jgi:hypothetical protein
MVRSLSVCRRISTRLIRVISQAYRRDRLLGLSYRQIITRLVGPYAYRHGACWFGWQYGASVGSRSVCKSARNLIVLVQNPSVLVYPQPAAPAPTP